MRHASLPWRRVMLFALLSLFDLGLTWFLIHNGQGSIYESNPIADAWLAAYGWFGLLLFKALCVGSVVVISLLVWLRFPRTACRVLTFACVATAAVNIYSMALIGYFNYEESAIAARWRHPAPAAATSMERPTIAPPSMSSSSLQMPTVQSKQPKRTRPVTRKTSRKPAVWLTTWPPQEEMYVNPARPGSGAPLSGVQSEI